MIRRWILAVLLPGCLCFRVSAQTYTAPQVTGSAACVMPEEAETFSEGLGHVVRACIKEFHPALVQASGTCLKIMVIVLILAMISNFVGKQKLPALHWAGVAAVGVTLLEPSKALMELGIQTVRDLSEYGKLLLPVMTGALAAQGGAGTAASLYTLTAFFDSLLSSAVSSIMIPMLYLFLGFSAGFAASGEEILGKFRDFMKWLMQWALKITLYLFTGFLSVTGAVSGSADAAALKAAKITISGAVPVVGSILSDASEAVLVGAGVMRSAVGVYGLIALCAIFLAPFVRMGAQYLMMKLTGGICSAFFKGGAATLVQDFCSGMGIVLAVTATQSVLLLISTVCLMKGIG